MRSARIKLPGHPDKVCDLLAEAIVDEYLRRDPEARTNISVSGGRGALFIVGDVRSQADFDVSALVRRILGSLGVMAEIEPFVSLEPVAAEQAGAFLSGAELPVTVTGYATDETAEMIPAAVLLAKRIAKRLEEVRQHDEAWFWLGPDAEVSVSDFNDGVLTVQLQIEHGTQPITDVRQQVEKLVASLDERKVKVSVNPLGTNEVRGLGNVMGVSGRESLPYGDLIPFPSRAIGKDVHRSEKSGAWLARSVARKLVLNGARAVLVTATYFPGEKIPSRISARDERGRDLSSQMSALALDLQRVAREWWRPQLNFDAARWGFAGEGSLPWEM